MVDFSSALPWPARSAYHWAAAVPTRLLVATANSTSTRSGWSIARRMAIVPPRLKPATAAAPERALAVAADVIEDHAVAERQVGDRLSPEAVIVGEAVDEDQWRA